MNYPVVIQKENHNQYTMTVPDLPGCFATSPTMEDALEKALDTIFGHAEGLMLKGEPVPPPTSIELHRNNEVYKDGVWALVTIDLTKITGKAKRINITLPERMLILVDTFAKKRGETRSGLFLKAALEYISQHGAG